MAAAIENQSLKPVVKTGQALLELGAITDAQLDLALTAQQSEPGSQLGEILVNQGLISREQLRMALATKMGIPLVDTVNFPVDVASLMLLPVEAAVKYSMVPLMRIGPSLVVAADDPLGLSTKEDLRFALGRKVIPVLSEQRIDDALIDGIYAEFGLSGEQGRYGSLTDQLRKAGSQDLGSAGDLVESLEAVASAASDIAETDIAPNDNALVRLINHIIIEANFHGASDIHI
ncbi:MAG: pilus assembly protein PilB, partial [Hydrogenophaga sp.]|nr:pilus assembly protein PilB [Hydrogenophaga sp.]